MSSIRTYPGFPEMISSHTLAYNIITRHNTGNDVFNTDEFSLLQRFTDNPSSKDTLLSGSRSSYATLVQHIIARHDTSNPALTANEITLLSKFFSALSDDLSVGARDMIRARTLAYNIILRPYDIFDREGQEFAIMREFTALPDPADVESRKTILQKYDMLDAADDVDDPAEWVKATAAMAKGSLSGYCVASFGEERSGISAEEVKVLGEWFANGGPA